MSVEILSSPDEAGWFWYKSDKKSEPVCVYVNDDGVAVAMTRCGDSYELDDLIGLWEPAQSQFL